MRPKSLKSILGVSLIELLTVMSIISIVTAIATPSFVGLIQKFRVMGEANALAGALAVARSEAIRQGAKVTLCISTDGVNCDGAETNWLMGWVIFATPVATPNTQVPLRVQNKWKGNDLLKATQGLFQVDFNRDGFPSNLPANGTVTFLVDTNPQNPAARHCVTLSLTGRRDVQAHGQGAC